MLDGHNGNIRTAVAAYNLGMGTVDSVGIDEKGRSYVAKVNQVYRGFKGESQGQRQCTGGDNLRNAAPILMSGHPGRGKTPLATGVALASCRQGAQVRFDNAAGLINALIQAQDDHRVPRRLAAALNQHLCASRRGRRLLARHA